jgi:DNA-directed RNA polymerase subunit RPC12/RpoP
MASKSLLAAAKQGDPQAIAELINKNLSSKGVMASIAKSDSCLRVMLESSSLPDQITMTRFIRDGIEKLDPLGIDKLKIFGRQKGDDMPEWTQEVKLVAQPVVSPGLADARFTTPELVPANRASDLGLGSVVIVGSLILFAIPLLGWILGIIGLFAGFGMIGSAISGKGTLKGDCPYCGAEVSAMENLAGVDCDACKKRILIKDLKFWQVD